MNRASEFQSYYTKSTPILNYMINMLQLGDGESILEPCGGDGVFVDSLLSTNSSANIDILELNPEAVTFLKEKYKKKLNVSVKETDTLLDNDILLHRKKYDKIIGNPPYGAKNDTQRKICLNRMYPGLYTKESYTLFLYACINCLREEGILSYIIPDTFLSLHRHVAVRKFLLTKTKIKELALFPSSFFPGVNFGYANLCIITLIKSSDIEQNLRNEICIRRGFRRVEELEKKEGGKTKIVSQKEIYENVGSAFLFNSTDKISKLINDDSLLKIGNLAHCVTGFYSGNDQKYLHPIDRCIKNARKYQVISKEFISKSPLSDNEKVNGISSPECFVPIVKGGNVEYVKPVQWFMNWSKQAILEYKASKKCRFQNSAFYFKKGIGIPMIRSSKLTGALIDYQLFDQSIVGVFPKDESLILYLLGFFNSQVCTELISAINPSANNSANYIKKIPFIEPNAEFKDKVENIVNKIISELKIGNSNIQKFQEELDVLFSNLYLENKGCKHRLEKKLKKGKQLSIYGLGS